MLSAAIMLLIPYIIASMDVKIGLVLARPSQSITFGWSVPWAIQLAERKGLHNIRFILVLLLNIVFQCLQEGNMYFKKHLFLHKVLPYMSILVVYK